MFHLYVYNFGVYFNFASFKCKGFSQNSNPEDSGLIAELLVPSWFAVFDVCTTSAVQVCSYVSRLEIMLNLQNKIFYCERAFRLCHNAKWVPVLVALLMQV